MIRRPPRSTLFPYTDALPICTPRRPGSPARQRPTTCATPMRRNRDRKSTRLNSSHLVISYAVFCLKKKKTKPGHTASELSIHLDGLARRSPLSQLQLLRVEDQ